MKDEAKVKALSDRFWRQNMTLTFTLLGIWVAAGLGAGVWFAGALNAVNLPGTGYPLGFWFAHQGAIIVFVLLVLSYALIMNRLEARHHAELEALEKESGQ